MIMNMQQVLKLGVIAMIIFSLVSTSSAKNNKDMTVKEGFVEVSGGKIWYQIVGADQKGIPLLVVHGGPGAPHDYLETLAELADQRPVIFYDQLGCGNSDRPEDESLWSVDRFVEELVTVRSALKLEQIHLLGQSWGTMLSVEYLLRNNPSGIQSLILSAPFLSTPIWAADQRELISKMEPDIQDIILRIEKSGDYDAEEYQEAMMAFYRKHLCRMDPWPKSLLRTMDKMGLGVYEYMWGPSEFTITGTLLDADLTGELKKITVPTLFTCGEYDEATPKSTKLFHSQLPGSEIHIFPDASHQHHIEAQAEYHQLLREWLSQHE
jgi:proline-specific peptidase